jgi:hypothetical protein
VGIVGCFIEVDLTTMDQTRVRAKVRPPPLQRLEAPAPWRERHRGTAIRGFCSVPEMRSPSVTHHNTIVPNQDGLEDLNARLRGTKWELRHTR